MIHKIVETAAEQILNIRREVMRSNMPFDYVRLANDNNKIIYVTSLFVINKEVQYRKSATLTDYQGKGYGTILLKKIKNTIENKDIHKICCNAKVDKPNYYNKFGMVLADRKFTKGGIEYVIMEKTFPNTFLPST